LPLTHVGDGSISVSDFRDAYFNDEQGKITATVNFEQAPPLDVRFGLIELQGQWLLVNADTLPRGTGGRWRTFCGESSESSQRPSVDVLVVDMSDGTGTNVGREDIA
jgi:hypothetical protein